MDWRSVPGVISPPADQNPAVVCAQDGNGCKGGWVGQAYRYAATSGLVPKAAWAEMTGNAYVESQYCPSRRLADYIRKVDVADPAAVASGGSSSGSGTTTAKIAGWETAPRTAMALMKVLANQPAVALVHAAPDWSDYRGGMYRGDCSAAADDANHAVVVVGYTADAWIVKNSWGAGWGAGGFMLLPRTGNSTNKCGVLNSVTYPVLDKVSPERRGELLRQGFCRAAGKVSLADVAAGNVSLAALAVRFGVPLNEMIRVNSHVQVGVDTPLELMTNYYIPPCTKEVPPQPVPKASCGTTYRIDAVADSDSDAVVRMLNAFEGAGEAGRAAQAQHAEQLRMRQRAVERQRLVAFEEAQRLRRRQLSQAGRMDAMAQTGEAAGVVGRRSLKSRRSLMQGGDTTSGSDPNSEPLPPTAWQHWREDYDVLAANINHHRFPRDMNTSDYSSVATTRLLLLREAFPVLLSPDSQPIAAATRYGAGRVLVLGQREMWREFYQPTDPTETGHVAQQLLFNGFGWLAGYGRPAAAQDGINATCYATGFAESVEEVFDALDVLAAGGPDGSFDGPPSYRETQYDGFPVDVLTAGVQETGRPYLQVLAGYLQDAIRNYVAAGGGLLVVHSSRNVEELPNAQFAPDETFAEFYSCNDLLGEMGILISPTPVEEAPLWRPPLPVPHPAPLSYLLLNAEAAVDTLRRYYAGLLRPGELDVDDFQAAVAIMEYAKSALKTEADLFPRLFNAIATVRGPPPPPQAPPSPPPPSPPPQGDDLTGVTRLGPVYTSWLNSYALEVATAGYLAISDYLDPYDVVCPRGTHVTGFKGRAWSTFDPAPWGATSGGMLVTEFALVCSNGKMLSVGYPTAPSKYDRYTNDPPYGNEGGLIPTGFEDSNDDGLNDSGYDSGDDVAPSFGVDWSEQSCPGGYDSIRVRPHSDDTVNFAKPLQMFFRCRDTAAFTTYTAGVGILQLSPEYIYDYDPATWYITSLRNLARGTQQLTELQYLAQLEDVPGVAACPPGQALAGLQGSLYVPHVTDLFDPEPYDQFLAPTGPLINPAPNGTAYLTSVTATGLNFDAGAAGGAAAFVDTVLTCGSGSVITGIVAAQEGATDINYLGVRCSDGSSQGVGSYHPSAESSGYLVDNPCLLGFDAVKAIGGRGVSYFDGSLGAGLGGFAVRCGSPLNEDGGGEAGSAWTRLGSSVLTGVNLLQQPSGGSSNSSGGGSLLYALTEASINAPGAVCSPGQRIAALRVQAVPLEVAGGAAGAGDAAGEGSLSIAAVHFYCGEVPGPPKDRSFLDIATRYGITLSDLYGANPTLDRTQPVAAYNGTIINVPQLCGAPPTQPPVTTIASGTCGDVARGFLRGNLPYLNTVNNGLCEYGTLAAVRVRGQSSHLRGVSDTDSDYRFSSLWAIDGSASAQDLQVTSGYFSSGRGDTQPWLSVDLGSPFYITAVVIRLRPGGVGASRLGNAEVRVGLTPIRSEPDDRPGLILNRLCGGRIATAAAPLAQGQDVVSVECGRPGSPPAGQWVTLQNFHPAGELLQVAELEVYVRGPVLSLGCGTEGVDCGGDGELVDDGAGGVQAETSPDAPPASASDPSGPRVTRLTNVTKPYRLGVSSLPVFASSSAGPDNAPEYAFDGIGVAPIVYASGSSSGSGSADPEYASSLDSSAGSGFFQSGPGDMNAYGNRLRNVSVWLSDAPATDAASVAALATAGGGARLCAVLDWVADEGEVVQLNCTSSGSSGRWVVVRKAAATAGTPPPPAGDEVLALAEVQVFGHRGEPPGPAKAVPPPGTGASSPPPPTGRPSLRRPPVSKRPRLSARPPRRPPPGPKRQRVRIQYRDD
eukprot:XP_001698559.1 predicted protein [Chlamydomonas reinhardtii]